MDLVLRDAAYDAATAPSRAMGYRRIILEAGTAQPEALALYTDEGYRRIPGSGPPRLAAVALLRKNPLTAGRGTRAPPRCAGSP